MSANPPANAGRQVVWVPSPNFTAGRRGQLVVAIVDHIMSGTLDGTDAWFQNSESKVSAHYGVGKDGRIHKFVSTNDEAWHAGVVHNPTARLVKEKPGTNPNLWTVGIEHEGQSGDELTDAQYAATLWLHERIVSVFRIPVDRDHVIGHHEVYDLHAGCPGPGFPFDRLLADLAPLQPISK